MGKKRMALDCETNGVDLYHGCRPFYVTICYDNDEPFHYEWDVDPKSRWPDIPKEDVVEIQSLIDDADEIIGQNLRFDIKMLSSIGINRWDYSKCHDTLMAGHLLASNKPHDLTSMVLQYLGIRIEHFEDDLEKAVQDCRRKVRSVKNKEFEGWIIASEGWEMLPSAGGEIWRADYWLPRAYAKKRKLPKTHSYWRVLSDYADTDSQTTMALWKVMEKLLHEKKLWKIYQERMKLLRITNELEDHGVTLSRPRLEQSQREYLEESQRLGNLCVGIAKTYNYDLVMPRSGISHSLNNFVFDVMKVPVQKLTEKGNPCLNASAMEGYLNTLSSKSKPHLFLKSLSSKRKRDTAYIYMEGYKRFWRSISDDNTWYKLHPSFNPTSTHTLRWSSSSPNAQNISKKEDFNLRYAFGPVDGREWWSLDFANLELRIPSYESGEEIMIEIFEKPDDPPYYGSYHLLNMSIIYPELFWPLADQKGAFKKKYASSYYQWGKNFGFAYGYSGGEETCDAAAHREGSYRLVRDRLKKLSGLNQKYIDDANKKGYVETLPDKTIDPTKGYPIYCTRNDHGTALTTVPLNYHVQSTGMWCTMKSMIRCDEYLKELTRKEGKPHYMTMQVHDEIVFDLPYVPNKGNLPKVKKLQKLMEMSGDDIGIPLKVSITYNPVSWSEGESLD